MSLPHAPQCVITGAGGGFGRALALGLSRRAARLLLADIDLPAAAETARLCLQSGASSAQALRCDVARAEDVEALAAACDGPVDLVVNNAGVASAGLVGELSLEDWRWTLDIDLYGVIYGCHVFTPKLRAQGHGHILNVSSASGLFSPPRMAAYSVAKAGVVALSETLAAELADSGVGVTVLCPTFFKTNVVSAGRFTDPKSRKLAEKMMARGIDASIVVDRALAAVEANTLYCIPMADGRWFWRLKRVAPGSFARVVRALSRRLG